MKKYYDKYNEEIEIDTIGVEVDNRIIEILTYQDMDINSLKRGTFFGLLVSTDNMIVMRPNADIYEDEIDFNLAADQDRDKYKLRNKVFEKTIPLIFKKLDDNFAQELLSGLVFSVRSYTDEIEETDSYELNNKEFQKVIERYTDNCILIDASYEPVYVADDNLFKLLYSEKTLPRKQEIIKALKSLNNRANTIFNNCLESHIKDMQSIAEVEDIMYDNTEHKKKIKSKTK